MKTTKVKHFLKKRTAFFWITTGAVSAVVVANFLPSLVSSDPCFDDWDIVCSTAPGYLVFLGKYSLVTLFLVVYIILPVTALVYCIRTIRKTRRQHKSVKSKL